MLMSTERTAPLGRYHRHLAGADFSLEANTGAVPQPGQFYVLRAGSVLMSSEDFAEAETFYKELCREFWAEHLGSPDPAVGLASAWGLLSLNVHDAAAAHVVQEQGSAADRKRLEQMRGRARAMARSPRWRKASAG